MEPALLQKLKGKFKKPEELPPIKLEDTESEEEEIDPAEAVKPAHVHSLLEHVFLTSMETINSHPDIDSELRSRNITHVLYLGPVNQVVIPRVIQCSISSEDKQNFDLLSHFDRTVRHVTSRLVFLLPLPPPPAFHPRVLALSGSIYGERPSFGWAVAD